METLIKGAAQAAIGVLTDSFKKILEEKTVRSALLMQFIVMALFFSDEKLPMLRAGLFSFAMLCILILIGEFILLGLAVRSTIRKKLNKGLHPVKRKQLSTGGRIVSFIYARCKLARSLFCLCTAETLVSLVTDRNETLHLLGSWLIFHKSALALGIASISISIAIMFVYFWLRKVLAKDRDERETAAIAAGGTGKSKRKKNPSSKHTDELKERAEEDRRMVFSFIWKD